MRPQFPYPRSDDDRFKDSNRLRFQPAWTDADMEWWKSRILDRYNLYPDEFADTLTKSLGGDRNAIFFEISPNYERFVVKVTGNHGDTGEAWWTERGVDLRGRFFQAREMVIPEANQQHGYGRSLMGDLFELALTMELERVDIEAQDIGRYAWIRAGFLPDNTGWRHKIRPDMLQRLNKARPFLSDQIFMHCLDMMQSDDPSITRAIAALANPVPSFERDASGNPVMRALGKVLLLEIQSDWCGSFDLRDETSISIYESYANRKIR